MRSEKDGVIRNFVILILALGSLLVFSLPLSLAAVPFGANVSEIQTTTAPADNATTDEAFAGNVTLMNIVGFTTTQSWQGYYGNVTGTVQLADANDNVMYNWTETNPKGQIYASTNSTITWGNIQCFNFTATGEFSDDSAQAGATSLYGTNLTQIQDQYGISNTLGDVDAVNETFIYQGGTGHRLFYVASKEFEAGECMSTRVYDDTGTGVQTHFEEALLYEPATTSVIFTSLLNRDEGGFDSATHDFEMLVLEDGHGTDISTTTYYFFVELQ